MSVTYLIAGSNLGDKMENLSRAGNLLSHEVGKVLASSSVYESEPWGFESENSFLNQVFVLSTHLSLQQLLKKIQDIELQLGRVRGKNQYTSRTMDIDILFFEDAILNTEDLTIPHPQIEFRRFVLMPMDEVAPDLIHPILNLNIHSLLIQCRDTGSVRQIIGSN